MKIPKVKMIASLEIAVILFILLLFSLANKNFSGKNFSVIVSFLVNAILIIAGIIVDQKAFSLNKTFWYFNFYFLFLAPLLQYLTGYSVWSINIGDDLYIKTNGVILLCYIVYFTVNFICSNKIEEDSLIKAKVPIIEFSQYKVLVLLLLSVFAFVFLASMISFNGLFVRDLNGIDIGDKTTSVIVENFCRSIPVYSLGYTILYYKKNKSGLPLILVESILLLIVNFPASITRYWIGLVYIGILLILFEEKIVNRRFDIFLIVVFSVIFPVFQLFKWYTLSDLISGGNIMIRLSNVYNSVDFDAYSVLARTIKLTSTNGIQYGHQVLASLFFIVPRSVWPLKPYPSGQFIAMATNQFYTNISCPIYAEGFIDFGLIGALLYTLLLSFFIRKFDDNFWLKKDENSYSFNRLIYPFLFGILIFLLRGSLQPVVVYSFTFFIFAIILKIWFKEK